MAELKDSGVRRQFESGAVRDSADGRGRCDLLPLTTIATYFRNLGAADDKEKQIPYNEVADILTMIDMFIREGTESTIYQAITKFINLKGYDSIISALLEVSKHYEDGARKYDERNWEKGIPCHCYVDSGIRHLFKWFDNWDDEPHDRAFLWNMLGLMWTVKNHPELNDLPYAEKFSKQNNDNDLVLVEVHNKNRIYRNAKTGEFIAASKAEDKEWGTVEERLDLSKN